MSLSYYRSKPTTPEVIAEERALSVRAMAKADADMKDGAIDAKQYRVRAAFYDVSDKDRLIRTQLGLETRDITVPAGRIVGLEHYTDLTLRQAVTGPSALPPTRLAR